MLTFKELMIDRLKQALKGNPDKGIQYIWDLHNQYCRDKELVPESVIIDERLRLLLDLYHADDPKESKLSYDRVSGEYSIFGKRIYFSINMDPDEPVKFVS